MERYAYFLLGLILLVPWGFLMLWRPDLRTRMLKASFAGVILGPLSEYWYLKDYWHPPVAISYGFAAPEDVLFGFGITGIAVAVADAVLQMQDGPRSISKSREYAFYMFSLLGGLLALTALTAIGGINSILASSFIWLLLAICFLMIRPDLFRTSIVSGAACVAVMLIPYLILFGWMTPEYIENYFLLTGTPLGIVLLPGVPMTEVVWYFSWGSFAGIVLNIASGRRKVSRY